MKSLIYTDVHYSQYSSILRKHGTKFSQRLEGIIKSLNWAENLAVEKKCDNITCLGDFFDQSHLNADELSALNEIKWANLPHVFLVGNHEMAQSSLEISSAHLLKLIPQISLVEKPTFIVRDNVEFAFLPYILELEREPLSSYFPEYLSDATRIIFSHNDIKGVQMGAFTSKEGFSVEDITNNCSLFINVHLHNGGWVESNKILNLGNLTGQNFSENASQYVHQCMVLEVTDKNITYDFIENPYAFNFYKLGIINNIFQIPNFKPNSIVSCGSKENMISAIQETLNSNPNVIESRVILEKEVIESDDTTPETKLEIIDHYNQFMTYVMENIGADDITLSELKEVLK